MLVLNSAFVVAPIHFIFPLASAGFSMLEASIAPSAPPAPTIVCISSINNIRFLLLSSSVIILESFSSNSPRYFVPAITEAILRFNISLFFKNFGTLLFTILLASSSTIAVFPTPASPISIGLFLFFLARISMTLSISLSLPITLSNSPFLAKSFRLVANSLINKNFPRVSVFKRLFFRFSISISRDLSILYAVVELLFRILFISVGSVISLSKSLFLIIMSSIIFSSSFL